MFVHIFLSQNLGYSKLQYFHMYMCIELIQYTMVAEVKVLMDTVKMVIFWLEMVTFKREDSEKRYRIQNVECTV